MSRQEQWRHTLLEQLSYLLLEVEALGKTLGTLPPQVIEARPMEKWSIKETLGHLADVDRHVFLPRFRRMVEDEAPVFENVDQDALVKEHAWNERSLQEIFEELAAARHDLLAFLKPLSPEAWLRPATFPDGEQRDIYQLAEYIAMHDVHHLRTLAERLHESHLTDRPVDLPK